MRLRYKVGLGVAAAVGAGVIAQKRMQQKSRNWFDKLKDLVD